MRFERLYQLITENDLPIDVLFDDANVRCTAFSKTHNQGHNSPRGKICYGWPEFFDFFESRKGSSDHIRNLFLDFDMDHLKGHQRDRHPLTQTRPGQSYTIHEEQIKEFRKQHPDLTPKDMLYYHPSGQGVTEYLIFNKSDFIPQIEQIVIHCKNEIHAYKPMRERLEANGYKNISRINSKILNERGYII